MKDDEVNDKELLLARSMKDVRKYIDECNLCQRMKNKIEVLVGKLMANEILKKI